MRELSFSEVEVVSGGVRWGEEAFGLVTGLGRGAFGFFGMMFNPSPLGEGSYIPSWEPEPLPSADVFFDNSGPIYFDDGFFNNYV